MFVSMFSFRSSAGYSIIFKSILCIWNALNLNRTLLYKRFLYSNFEILKVINIAPRLECSVKWYVALLWKTMFRSLCYNSWFVLWCFKYFKSLVVIVLDHSVLDHFNALRRCRAWPHSGALCVNDLQKWCYLNLNSRIYGILWKLRGEGKAEYVFQMGWLY